ncbi:MAG: DUF5009 domain-containing protein [Oculatellaceae cyanobacterium Prado106]|jgi:predicted acyltransferase|nr:DUF5009 domain-containing protein [Oculatellaceae cyanobacterium Prado106]
MVQTVISDAPTILRVQPPRAHALDALRGLAILAMIFSGTIRFRILPAWMYHAQNPPPTHVFNKAIAGLTWVDVVFPLFLFTMGAAIPFALSRRLQRGWSPPKIIVSIFKRGFLLAAFAIVVQHFRPFTINSKPTTMTWILALLGFGLLFLMFSNWIAFRKWARYRRVFPLVGWVVAIALITQLSYGGKGFDLNRSDPILMVLANMAVWGSLAWLFTRFNIRFRLGILVFLLALQFSAGSEGWVKTLWSSSPVPWLFQFYYLKYLFIVIPGTIAGDFILQRSQHRLLPQTAQDSEFQEHYDHYEEDWQDGRVQQQRWLILGSMLMLCFVLLVGLQSRTVFLTLLMCGAIAAATWPLFAKLQDETGFLIQRLYQWGVFWLFLGLCFEPFQGGIHKDPSTYSYYFVTTAIAHFLLIALTILIDYFHQKKACQFLIDSGRNPLIAYVAFGNLLWPLLHLTGLEDRILELTNQPVLGVLKGVAYTLPIALLTVYFTRIKLFWRI